MGGGGGGEEEYDPIDFWSRGKGGKRLEVIYLRGEGFGGLKRGGESNISVRLSMVREEREEGMAQVS